VELKDQFVDRLGPVRQIPGPRALRMRSRAMRVGATRRS
jgi:hypothetical protein